MKSLTTKLNFSQSQLVFPKFRLFVLLSSFAVIAILQPNCKCSLQDHINNFNAEPENLRIAIEPCNFVSEDLAPCWETPSKIDANVAIEIRTLKTDANGNVLPDELPYYELDEDRENMSCSATNPNNKFTVSVPKKGGYMVRITIKSLKCSMCCWGGNTDIQCGTQTEPAPNNKTEYSAGKPKWVVEQIFKQGIGATGGNTADWTPGITDYKSRKCTCGCKIIK